MKVHIVCHRPHTDRILARLARLLAEGTGWSLSEVPNEKADLNYAFPYLELRHWKGRCAAFFTHREDIIPAKVNIWRQQAKRAVLGTTWAEMYVKDLSQYGPTVRILPPLDRDKFCFGLLPKNKRPTLGVSGYTYSGGRKGEGLLTQVLKTPVGQKVQWRASGRGWPIETVSYPWAELHKFYQGLNVYVCTSLIEGVPYPPLEAMACGTRCVIPRGVGLLDELPDLPDLIRYKVGDAGDLALAIEKALDNRPVDREALRAATEIFTEDAWIEGHLDAFAKLESEPKTALPEPKDRRGIYIVAYGEPARHCAQRLIRSIRRHMPGMPIAVASDRPLGTGDVQVKHPDADAAGRTAKIKVYDLAPKEWEYILYLDADTEVVGDISYLFEALRQGWEMVITKDIDDYHLAHALFRRDSGEAKLGMAVLGSDQALQLAGGVIAFRKCPNTKAFFERWYKEWHILARRDQGALLRALYQSPVRVNVIGNEWNSFVGIFGGKTTGILHHRGGPARRWHWKTTQRMDSPEVLFRVHGGDPGILKDVPDRAIIKMITLRSFTNGTVMRRREQVFKIDCLTARELLRNRVAYPLEVGKVKLEAERPEVCPKILGGEDMVKVKAIKSFVTPDRMRRRGTIFEVDSKTAEEWERLKLIVYETKVVMPETKIVKPGNIMEALMDKNVVEALTDHSDQGPIEAQIEPLTEFPIKPQRAKRIYKRKVGNATE